MYVILFDTEQLLYDYQVNTKCSTIMRVNKLTCLLHWTIMGRVPGILFKASYISSVGLDLNLHVLQQELFIGMIPIHLQEESLSEVQLLSE